MIVNGVIFSKMGYLFAVEFFFFCILEWDLFGWSMYSRDFILFWRLVIRSSRVCGKAVSIIFG